MMQNQIATLKATPIISLFGRNSFKKELKAFCAKRSMPLFLEEMWWSLLESQYELEVIGPHGYIKFVENWLNELSGEDN